jgi:hypothetical protein
MQKQAIVPLIGLAARGAVGLASKALPKALTMGYKGLARPIVRTAFKRPGMALTGAMMPSWIGGYMNTAREKGLSSLPRSLPKFASIQGEEMSDEKYPSIFYKIEGFEKMAAEAEAAHRLVKKAWFGKLLGSSSSSAEAAKTVLGKALDAFAKNPEMGTRRAVEYGKDLITITNELGKKPPLWKEILQTTRNMPAALKIGLPIAIVYPFAHKAYKQYVENKETEGSYNDMLKIYPELQKENPRNTRQYFDYIKQYSPTVAKNPHAAGAIVRRFASTGGMAMDNSVIKNLLEVEKVKSDSKPRHEGVLGTIGALI